MLKKVKTLTIMFLTVAIMFSVLGLAQNKVAYAASSKKLKVTSDAFKANKNIPLRFANDEENVSIPLSWTMGPANTKSYALIMYDQHRIANNWVHWAVINIPPCIPFLEEGISGSDQGFTELINTFGECGYGGPQPPPGTGKHKYKIMVYALDTDDLQVSDEPTLKEFTAAVKKHILASGQLVGTFSR